ncbi:MAG: HAD-IIIA family hydrolase [Lachnospiraceae bacterium]|nr:HAD-IIIA family hydrolase [Lachnospiraceae bacterium]
MSIKLLVMDVDGTLTDGKIYIGDKGEMMKAFDVKDGYAIAHLLPENNIIPVIITGRSSDIVKERAKELKITELYQGINDKLIQLKNIAENMRCKPEEIAYIGDDENDLTCINYCGVTGCPNDAVDVVRQTVKYVCQKDGGRGAVREFVEWILKR